MNLRSLCGGIVGIAVVLVIGGTVWAQPRQVSNEPSTESFSGASERNWSSISFQAAYTKVLDGSGVNGFGIGANAAFIPVNRVGKGSLGLDVDAIVHFLSKEGENAGTVFLGGLGPIVRVFPNKNISLSLTLRPGISVSSDGTNESDFALSEAVFMDLHLMPDIGIGLAPTISQIFGEKEVYNLFHLSLMISFNY